MYQWINFFSRINYSRICFRPGICLEGFVFNITLNKTPVFLDFQKYI